MYAISDHHFLWTDWSHGFSPVFKDQTGIESPAECDVILCAPKGSGRTVRTLFKEGRGINSSVAVFQDKTGKALEKAVAMSVAVGSGYTYESECAARERCGARADLFALPLLA